MRRRARDKGLAFNISAEDIVVPAVCPIFLTPFVFGEKYHPQAPSVDRIDNTKGYVKGNVAVISVRANVLKSNFETSVFRRLVKHMEQEYVLD